MTKKHLLLCALALIWSSSADKAHAADKTCLYVSSYHSGYEWSDGIEKGLEDGLGDSCKLEKFYMDTKRNKSVEFSKQKSLEAKKIIDATKPDVVIACDDNASKYLVMPYYKNAETPFVFCGVNHNVDSYGYPYDNVTGMIEIAPVDATKNIVKEIVPNAKKGVYLSMDVTSQHKEYDLNKSIYAKSNIEIDRILITNMDEWVEGFKKAQEYEFIIVGSSGGIQGWDIELAKKTAEAETRNLTVTNMSWLDEISMITVTKIAEEQGEWSAKVAQAILMGTEPLDIPIIVNRKWDLRINPELIKKTEIEIPQSLYDKAVKEEF